ncbi:MAG: hypothetical protein CNIPEHKO_02777 [Anaerolineales bacterium]|nr:hypothetical protein [Anaerolineales bacterium]
MGNDASLRALTQKYFGFLVTEYAFKHDDRINAFDNGYVRYKIEQLDIVNPSIEVWLKSEPKYTRIDVSWLIDKYIDYSAINKSLFEDQLSYYASLFHAHSHELFYDLNDLLLEGIKKLVIRNIKVGKMVTKTNYQYHLASVSQLYYYIKRKDPKWDIAKYL